MSAAHAATAMADMAAMAARLEAVTARISRACAQAGRGSGSVRLIAVSKRQPVEALAQAYALGVRDFGENYVQELDLKRAELPDPAEELRWHFIGNLQSNKAKLLARGPLTWAHALDRGSQVKALVTALAASARSSPLEALVEVNVAGEATKGGVTPQTLWPLLDEILAAPRQTLRLRGLMTMPPWSEDPEGARPHFATLRGLLDEARRRYPDAAADLTELSMGMSHDMEAAIREGATMVRVGTAIFGERHMP